MRRVLILAGVVAIATGLFMATEFGSTTTSEPTNEAEPATCVDGETSDELEQMTPDELEQWALDTGIIPAESAGGQGCDTSGPCSGGVNCTRTSTCYGLFDSGETKCGGVKCGHGQTVHFYRCICTGDLCPLYEATRYHCA